MRVCLLCSSCRSPFHAHRVVDRTCLPALCVTIGVARQMNNSSEILRKYAEDALTSLLLCRNQFRSRGSILKIQGEFNFSWKRPEDIIKCKRLPFQSVIAAMAVLAILDDLLKLNLDDSESSLRGQYYRLAHVFEVPITARQNIQPRVESATMQSTSQLYHDTFRP